VRQEEQEVGMAKDWSSKARYTSTNSYTYTYTDTGCDTYSYANPYSNDFAFSHHCTCASELCGILQSSRL
jgi:hypothetical protein